MLQFPTKHQGYQATTQLHPRAKELHRERAVSPLFHLTHHLGKKHDLRTIIDKAHLNGADQIDTECELPEGIFPWRKKLIYNRAHSVSNWKCDCGLMAADQIADSSQQKLNKVMKKTIQKDLDKSQSPAVIRKVVHMCPGATGEQAVPCQKLCRLKVFLKWAEVLAQALGVTVSGQS